jgi:hypothetical protein
MRTPSQSFDLLGLGLGMKSFAIVAMCSEGSMLIFEAGKWVYQEGYVAMHCVEGINIAERSQSVDSISLQCMRLIHQ